MPRKKPASIPRIISEYQNEYCGVGPKVNKMRGADLLEKKENNVFPICRKTYERQPVGGRKAPIGAGGRGGGVADVAFSALLCPSCRALSESDQHMKQVEAQKMREGDTNGSTKCDLCGMECESLSVPDVHKLRYLHNRYMTADDWR